MAHKNVDMPCNNEQIPEHGSQAEAWALTEAGRRMKAAAVNENQSALLAAVNLNWRLWTIFQAQLLAPGCEVPTDIRDNMISLSNFVDKVSVETITDIGAPSTKEKIEGLIEINRQIASGLLGLESDDNAMTGVQIATFSSEDKLEEVQNGWS